MPQKQNSNKFKRKVNVLAQLKESLEVCLQEWLDPDAQREIRVLSLSSLLLSTWLHFASRAPLPGEQASCQQ